MLFHHNELVFTGADTDLFRMLERLFPGNIRIAVLEDITLIKEVRVRQMFTELAVRERSRFFAQIHAGLIESYRIEGGEHSDVRKDRGIIFTVAVAVRGDVRDETDVEGRSSAHDGSGIFGHLAAEDLESVAVAVFNGVERAGTDAAPAALADLRVDMSFFILIADGVRAAFLCTASAAAAEFFIDMRFAVIVLLHFAGAAAAAHTDILYGAAEAGAFVTFKMCEGDEDVRIHNRPSDVSFGAVFTVRNRNKNIVGSAQAVTDEDLTSGGNGIEAVQAGAFEMFKRILAAARIKRVAVCQERHASVFFDDIRNNLCVVRAQKGEISEFSEMHLDGDELAVHVDFFHAGFFDQTGKLFSERNTDFCSEIGEVNFGSTHNLDPFIQTLVMHGCHPC